MRMLVRFALLSIVAAFLAGTIPMAAKPLERVAATTINLPRAAPTVGFTTTRTLGNLRFNQPLAVVSPPGETHRLFVVEKTGRILVVPDLGASTLTSSVFLDLRSEVGSTSSEQGLLALAFHPDFATNGYFYVWFTLSTTTAAGSGRHDRLARFKVSSDDPNRADPQSEVPLITQRDEASNHNGGQILFGPDGYLYLSIGDEGGGGDQFGNGQRIDRDFFATILRLDVDHRPGSLEPNSHPAVNPGTYWIPPDNPFVGASTFNGSPVDPAQVRTEMWAIGLRNPWRMSFDAATGQLWVGDVGQNAHEEVDIITPGGNYGWHYREGFSAYSGTPPAGATFIDPVYDYLHSQGNSITGGIVYRGAQFSQLYGAYLFADYGSGRIWSLRRDDDGPAEVNQLAIDPGIVSFGINPHNGDVLLADIAEGVIKRLAYSSNVTGDPLPETLSATGVFSDLATLEPVPGVVAYEPNVSFWSDHARKRRWFALRDATSTLTFQNEANWTLPDTAVWVKHFDLELVRGDPDSARRIETRCIVKTDDGVYGVTYRWNHDQTEATLVSEDGADEDFTIMDDGIERTQTWHYPSRAECLACHTPKGGYALSFNTRQLNRIHDFPGGAANQIEALAGAGYFSNSPPPSGGLASLANAEDLTKTQRHRARSYLDANCAMCHQPGGAALGTWDARFHTPLSVAGIVDGALVDDGGDENNRVVAPGDSDHSRILQRMRGLTATRMPPVATRERDLGGEALIEAWITGLATSQLAPRVANFSGRAHVGIGEDALIPGFVIDGNAPRTVLVRAVGPALTSFGVTNVLTQPILTLLSGAIPLASNQGWSTATNAAEIADTAALVGAFPLPSNSADSAILMKLEPGAYTAQATGRAGTTGEALVEVYDAEPTTTASRLVNTAMRARLTGSGDLLIPGLVIREGDPAYILTRAVGPGLGAFGVTDPLARPSLGLFRGPDRIAANLGWNTAENVPTVRASAASVGAFALDEGSADSALLATLPPGAYTLHVGSADESPGVVLVEVYELP